jgi:trehalose 6-phosphate synthase
MIAQEQPSSDNSVSVHPSRRAIPTDAAAIREVTRAAYAKYGAAQDPDNPGVLVLSQFAGASRELDAALVVNPYDQAGVAVALDRALAMPGDARRERHASMLQVMRRNSLGVWRDPFEANLAT